MQEIDTPLPEAAETGEPPETPAEEPVSADDLLAGQPEPPGASNEELRLRAVLEAVVYVADEPLSLQQIAAALGQPADRIQPILDQLVEDYDRPEHGLTIREVAGGYKMATKAEHHEAVRNFVKSLKPPLKLSLAALETLAVIAYKQPVTAPEIGEIRGVQGTGVLKTLLDRKLIAAAGRKNVIGKPILYKTTKEFLVQFGLKDLAELPTLKEFEEIGRMALGETEPPLQPPPPATEPPGPDVLPEPPAGDPPTESPDIQPPPSDDPPRSGSDDTTPAPISHIPSPAERSDASTPAPGPRPPAPKPTQSGGDQPPAPKPTQSGGDQPPAPEPTQSGGDQPPAPKPTQSGGDDV